MDYDLLIRELLIRKEKVYNYISSSRFKKIFSPQHIHDSIYSYINYGGKALRPSVLLFSCGAVGGDEDKIIPAAAAIEIFHTWTIVHDDIIDRDHKRRGGPTIHEEFRQRAIEEFGYNEKDAQHYGTSIAILAGDMQQGWSVSMFSELGLNDEIDPRLVLYLIKDFGLRMQSELIEGQVLDIQYSKEPIESLNEEQIMKVMWKKTGVLYEFAGKAGAMLGLNTLDTQHPFVYAISSFTGKCGTAFQLQDDILGIVGDEEKLGKPIGSDIREGKRTIIISHAFKNASDKQKRKLSKIIGNQKANDDEINEVKNLLIELGSIDWTENLAEKYIRDSLKYLDIIPQSKYKELLLLWADYMVHRKF